MEVYVRHSLTFNIFSQRECSHLWVLGVFFPCVEKEVGTKVTSWENNEKLGYFFLLNFNFMVKYSLQSSLHYLSENVKTTPKM